MTTKLVDLSALIQISSDDTDFITQYIETFIRQTKEDIASLKVNTASKDWPRVKNSAHRMRSSFNLLGLDNADELCEQIEIYSMDASQQAKIHLLVEQVAQCFSDVEKELAAYEKAG